MVLKPILKIIQEEDSTFWQQKTCHKKVGGGGLDLEKAQPEDMMEKS